MAQALVRGQLAKVSGGGQYRRLLFMRLECRGRRTAELKTNSALQVCNFLFF